MKAGSQKSISTYGVALEFEEGLFFWQQTKRVLWPCVWCAAGYTFASFY